MVARIYRPAKTAMQSGQANAKLWVLEVEPSEPRTIEPLMGWTASADTSRQVRLRFDTREEAVAYAKEHGLAFQVTEPRERKRKSKSYADNFSADRKVPWTH